MLAVYGSVTVPEEQLTLAQFIEFEMKRREMGVREFARFIGVSPSAISKHTNRAHEITPSIEFLVNLAEKTETDLMSILAMAFPAIADKMTISPRAMILAQRLDNLPKAAQDMILAFVISQK